MFEHPQLESSRTQWKEANLPPHRKTRIGRIVGSTRTSPGFSSTLFLKYLTRPASNHAEQVPPIEQWPKEWLAPSGENSIFHCLMMLQIAKIIYRFWHVTKDSEISRPARCPFWADEANQRVRAVAHASTISESWPMLHQADSFHAYACALAWFDRVSWKPYASTNSVSILPRLDRWFLCCQAQKMQYSVQLMLECQADSVSNQSITVDNIYQSILIRRNEFGHRMLWLIRFLIRRDTTTDGEKSLFRYWNHPSLSSQLGEHLSTDQLLGRWWERSFHCRTSRRAHIAWGYPSPVSSFLQNR